jgi:hypothetical protein
VLGLYESFDEIVAKREGGGCVVEVDGNDDLGWARAV